jgi:murein DD-endopeptidase MepM/ murein hydrolase activator NlpD
MEVFPGLWQPMDGISAMNPLEGGYAFLDYVDAQPTYHPGVDLNAGGGGDNDLGFPLRFPEAGRVRFVEHWEGVYGGYGSHIWIELEQSGLFLHYAHCDTIQLPVSDLLYPAGTILGTCGRSGFQSWAHCHFEVRRENPATSLGYTYWPSGQSSDFVTAHYLVPSLWWLELLQQYSMGIATPMLEDWQVKEWIMRPLWEGEKVAFNPDAAIVTSWLSHYRSGDYKGVPREDEQPIEHGAWQPFEYGVAIYQEGREVSWNG